MLDIRSFESAVKNEEVAHTAYLHMSRVQKMADFDARLCFGHEDEARLRYDSAALKINEAMKLFADGCADYFAAAAFQAEDSDQNDILSRYSRRFREKC